MKQTEGLDKAQIQDLLADLERSIRNLQESVRESVFRKNYVEADEKQRELLRLKQFYHAKADELQRIDSFEFVEFAYRRKPPPRTSTKTNWRPSRPSSRGRWKSSRIMPSWSEPSSSASRATSSSASSTSSSWSSPL